MPTSGLTEFFRGQMGHEEQKKKRVWVAFGAQPTVQEQVMCQFSRQRGRVGAHLGRSPVELGLGGEGM